MKRLKVSLCLLLCAVMMISTTACGESSKGDTLIKSEPTNSTIIPKGDLYSDPSSISKEVIQPTFMLVNDKGYTGDEIVWKAIEKHTNIDFKVIPVPLASWKEKLSTTLASGNIPDIIGSRDAKTVDKYGPQGAFLSFEPYIKKDMMPNYVKVLTDNEPAMKLATSHDGKRYGAPRIYATTRMDEAFVGRIDVFERLGLSKTPKDFDELYQSLLKIKQAYPDSTPYINRWETVHLLSGPSNFMGTSYTYFKSPDTNTFEWGPSQKAYKDVLVFLAKLYKDGLLDPDFATLSDKEYEEKFMTNKAFLTIDYQTAAGYYTAGKSLLEKGWDSGPILQPEYNGKRYGCPSLKGYFGYTKAVSSKTKYPEELAKFIDWTYSDAGSEVLMFGIKDVDYKKDTSGKVTMISDIQSSATPNGTIISHGLNDQFIFSVLPKSGSEFYENVDDFTVRQKKFLTENNAFAEPEYSPKFFNEDENKKFSDIRTALETYIFEASTQVIIGKTSIEDWDSKVIEGAKALQMEEGLELIRKANKETFGE